MVERKECEHLGLRVEERGKTVKIMTILLHEPLGCRLPLPHVLHLCGYVFELTTNGSDA